MVSVAAGGGTERIKARILFKVVGAGSGTRARYSSMSFGAALRFAAEPRARAFAFFILGIPPSVFISNLRPGLARRRGVWTSASGLGACARLHLVESAASPGLRYGEHDEGEGIPVRPEGRSLVPGHGVAHNAHGKTDEAAHQGVQHGPVGREPRDDVATHNAVDTAIGRCKQEGPLEARHRPPPSWQH